MEGGLLMSIKKISVYLIMMLVLTILPIRIIATDGVPSFKITGIGKTPGWIAITVPPKTTDKEIVLLINEFKRLNEKNQLDKYFKPTTPGAPCSEFTFMDILIFKDANKATTKMLNKYINCSSSQKDMSWSEKYAESILGEYIQHNVYGEMVGCLGSNDYNKLNNFKPIFNIKNQNKKQDCMNKLRIRRQQGGR